MTKKLSSAALMLFVSLLMFTLPSCKNNDAADFINSLKEIAVKSESAKAEQILDIKGDLVALMTKYATSKAEVTPEQKATIVDLLTDIIKNVLPASIQSQMNPQFIASYTESFRQAATTDLESLNTIGEIASHLSENI